MDAADDAVLARFAAVLTPDLIEGADACARSTNATDVEATRKALKAELPKTITRGRSSALLGRIPTLIR